MPRPTLSDTFALVARSLPEPDLVADPRAFAWEVLRRRADYRSQSSDIEQLGSKTMPIVLIRPQGTTADWGLRFRRSGRSRRPQCALVLGRGA